MTNQRTYSVYEKSPKNYIGSVEAETLNGAIEKAHRQYGAPIIVEP